MPTDLMWLPFSCVMFVELLEGEASEDGGWHMYGVCATLKEARALAYEVAKKYDCKAAVVGTHAFHDWHATNDGPLMDIADLETD